MRPLPVDGESMHADHASPSRHAEQGGITILTTLGLLVLLTVLVFSLGKSSLRELTVTGTVWQAAKASEAAEAGLDWFILWTNPTNAGSATTAGRETLVTAFNALNAGTTWSDPTINPYLLNSAKPWDRAASLTSTPSTTGSDMVFANTGTGYLQSGSEVKQSFDLMFRFLGTPLVNTVSSGGGNPAGQGSGTGRQSVLFQLQSTGKASIPTGGTYMNYRATREMYLTLIP
ncbi:hypothetical protein GETHOR_10010 [Geothrix oryzae]|uniref:Type 4 fimbrial biogenesis protein PilX N-terminal domain-containing protein n=2 Tax=Geothrix oryzae TaxID=2927975 RepID=A0ABN6V3A5_9BACT|nr:hypothetical protein GETHOR_10010 [Geothrix oryzae]